MEDEATIDDEETTEELTINRSISEQNPTTFNKPRAYP